MRRWALVALGVSAAVLGISLASSRNALAAPQASLPDGRLTIATNGPPAESINESISFDAQNQEFRADVSGTIDGLDVTFTGLGDPDPSVSYELTVDNNTAGTRDVFMLFRIPTVESTEATVTADLDVTLVDRNGGGVFGRVVDTTPIQQALGLVGALPIAVSLTVPLGTADIETAGLTSFSAGPKAAPDPIPFGGPYSGLEVRANLELSPGDRATIVGSVVLTPEPAASLALAGALVSLGALASRRRAGALRRPSGNG